MKRPFALLVLLCLTCGLQVVQPLTAAEGSNTRPSVTVYPVVTSPHRLPEELARRVGIVVATILERAGLEDLNVAETAFVPPETNDVDEIAKAFSQHVIAEPVETDYAVLAIFVGTPQTGIDRIRTIVVDKSGEVLLADSADEAQLEKAAPRPKDPMTCCLFVGRRLQQFWSLEDPLRENAPQGNMARFWKTDAGIPAEDELDAIRPRAELLKENIRVAACTVYPIRAGQQSDEAVAADLVESLKDNNLFQAELTRTDPALEIASHSNQQKVLWDTARAFRDFLRKHPPEGAYALYADYGLAGDNIRYVHAIICDRSGDWVRIEMQNSHHPEFQRIGPKTAADCNRLVIACLQTWLDE